MKRVKRKRGKCERKRREDELHTYLEGSEREKNVFGPIYNPCLVLFRVPASIELI
jgi:hypothetical protein